MIGIKRLVRRGLYYVQTGATLGGLPLSLLNFSTIFYYNVIFNVGFLKNFFTNFPLFVFCAGICITLSFGFLGYGFKRRSKFYTSQVEVDIDANPYQTVKIVPSGIPAYEAWCEFFDRQGINCEGMKELLRNSGSLKYTKEKQNV